MRLFKKHFEENTDNKVQVRVVIHSAWDTFSVGHQRQLSAMVVLKFWTDMAKCESARILRREMKGVINVLFVTPCP